MELTAISRIAAKEEYRIDIGDEAFMFTYGETLIVFNLIHLKELICDMTPKTQQELYQYLNTLGCRINK